MTIAEALNMIAPVRLIIHGQGVFFNTFDQEEVAYWSHHGAKVREFYTDAELARLKNVNQGWEVHMLGAIDPVLVTKLNGETEDQTKTLLAAGARERRQAVGV